MHHKSDFSEHTLYVDGVIPIHVMLADTPQEQQKGLGGRDAIDAGEGMLFVFDTDEKWRIWMKDMRFGIDIIWLDAQGRIVDIRDHVYPESYEKAIPDIFEPKEKARYVLEVIAGYTQATGIHIGDIIKLGLGSVYK